MFSSQELSEHISGGRIPQHHLEGSTTLLLQKLVGGVGEERMGGLPSLWQIRGCNFVQADDFSPAANNDTAIHDFQGIQNGTAALDDDVLRGI